MAHQYTNELQHSTSPYLLQHAHNPVNWIEWSDNTIEKAKNENKLILISIGYAACHWCHVMEHESFEDLEVAKLMNRRFVCVKVDREERPDVDHYYMSALQLMGIQGGWPLNVIALPDGKPIWGGTYFPKNSWMKILQEVSEFHHENNAKTEEFAERLHKNQEQLSLIKERSENDIISIEKINEAVNGWKNRFDFLNGGRKGQPKFPMPVNLNFLLKYGVILNDKECADYVLLTLLKMARGGIYDQIGGGFARYSVDEIWKVPHFEKMLYDNGQLISIYSHAYQQFKNEELKTVVYETIDFIEREMMDNSGAFYSSLDADSEGEEGRFYVWPATALRSVLKNDYQLFSEYYHVNELGQWENDTTILLRTEDDFSFAKAHQISLEELTQKVKIWKKTLMHHRSKRVRPGLDDKTLTSWNALVIQGLTDAYKAFGDEHFLQLATQNACFLKENVMKPDGGLWHSWKNGKATINGFLEDYSFLIQALISLFEVSGNKEWLYEAQKLTNYSLNKFYDKGARLFYFSEKESTAAIINHFQNEDNVTPASNSVMANNLFHMGLLFGNTDFLTIAKSMALSFSDEFLQYPMAYSNWGTLMLKQELPFFEVAICGENAKNFHREMQNEFYPNVLWAFAAELSEIPLLKDRFMFNENLIYICRKGACLLPVKSVEEARKILK